MWRLRAMDWCQTSTVSTEDAPIGAKRQASAQAGSAAAPDRGSLLGEGTGTLDGVLGGEHPGVRREVTRAHPGERVAQLEAGGRGQHLLDRGDGERGAGRDLTGELE